MEANKLEKLYKEAFKGYEYNLSDSFWQKLKWRLLWFELKYYLMGAGAVTIVGAGLYFGLNFNNPVELKATLNANNLNYQAKVVHALAIGNSVADNITEKSAIHPEIDRSNKPRLTIEKSSVSDHEVFYDSPARASEEERSIDSRPFRAPFETTVLSGSARKVTDTELIYDSTLKFYIPQKKVNYSLSLYFTTAYNVPIIQTAGGYDDYVKYRNDHESASYSFSAGIDFQLNIKNWFVQTGLNYSRFANHRNYNHTFMAYDSLRSYYTYDTTWGYLFDPPDIGTPVVIGIDSTWQKVFNDINEGKNEWSYLEVPILVGYQFIRSRFTIDLATGISYGFLIRASGNVPSLTDSNRFDELSESDLLFNQNQINYIFQAGISYHLTPNWSIMAKPYYKQNLRSVFSNTFPIDQRFRAFGIKFGLIVYL